MSFFEKRKFQLKIFFFKKKLFFSRFIQFQSFWPKKIFGKIFPHILLLVLPNYLIIQLSDKKVVKGKVVRLK